VDRQQHWQRIYETNQPRDVSWFEATPAVSLQMLEAAGLTTETCVVDVGGGDSHLIDALLTRGLHCLAVLDISAAALARARARLGPAAHTPIWIEADVTGDWSLKPMDIWHDRAAFHFLTEQSDRERYLQHLGETLKPGGTAVIATFALDGPERCSGLPVVRYSPETLAAELGPAFRRVEALHHLHETPAGAHQSFQYSRFVRVG
jgi:SAM-dependent methyltransferase